MKKLLLPMIAVILLMAGCTEKAQVITSYYTVDPNKWEQSITTYDNGTYDVNYYYSTWENVDITSDVIREGIVLVYYIENGRDNILPYTMYLKGTDDSGNTVYYQERIEYDIEPGLITFKIKDSDFNTATSMQNIGTLEFKVCVIGNN